MNSRPGHRYRCNFSLRHFWFLCLLVMAQGAHGEKLHVAVASNFIGPMNALVAGFESRYPHTVTVSSGSSGKLYAQIHHGAPYHLMFSADQEKPALLENEGLAVAGSRFTYAVGKLVLWSAQPGLISAGIPLNELLIQKGVRRIALANPRLAPYGAAAVDVLGALDLRERTRPLWIQGENIAQTYQFVRTGNADLGFVALSQLLSDRQRGAGPYLTISDQLHRAIRQDAVLLKAGQDNPAAEAFVAFVRGAQAAEVIAAYGYEIPAEGGTAAKQAEGELRN